MSILTRVCFLVSATLPVSFSAFADNSSQPDTIVDEIVVEAFRLDTTASESGSSVWVVDNELIEQRGYVHMTDALTTVPGVTINQNGAFGGAASARIRGSSSDQTLVLIDGIMVNDVTSPGGGFDVGVMDVSNVERIEVLKGPQSTLWGSDAIGGVINIVSRRANDGLVAEISGSGGSFGTHQYQGAVSGGNDVGDFRLSYYDFTSDGISKADENDGNTEDDSHDAQTLSFRAGLNLPADARLELNYRSTEADTEFDSFGFVTGVEDGNERSESESTTTQVSLTIPTLDGRLQNTFRYADTEIDRQSFASGLPSFGAEGDRKIMQYQGTFLISDSQQISLGYEDEDTDNGNNDASNKGIYALYQVNPTEALTISMGLRKDDPEAYGDETVARISGAWQASENLGLRASWGEGFKVPTIFQTTFFCCGAAAPNPNLQPEESEAFDIGLDWQFEQGTLSLTYFDQDTTNQINFSFAVGGYENLDEVDSKGMELAIQYGVTETLSTSVNITRIDSEDGNGNDLIRMPEITADLSLIWQPTARLNSAFAIVYNDDEKDSRGTVDSWTRVDLSASYEVNNNLRLFARIENLFDEDYQQIFGYGTPERSGYVGLKYTFNQGR